MESPVTPIRSIASDRNEFRREHLLKMLSAASFLIVFQGYMVAPLIPRLFLVKLDALRGYDFEAGVRSRRKGTVCS